MKKRVLLVLTIMCMLVMHCDPSWAISKVSIEDKGIDNGKFRYGIKPAQYDIPAGENGTSFNFFADGSNTHFAADDNPDIHIESDDPIEIAKAYVELYDSWKWSGSYTNYNSHKISFRWGEICIDDVLTGVKCNERLLYDKAKTAYLNGQWDGTLAILDSHYIELSSSGELLIDGYLSVSQQNLDLPDDFDFGKADTNYVCIPPYGTFIIENKNLVNYIRQKRTKIKNVSSRWIGYNSMKPPFLKYDEDEDKLYLNVFDSNANCYTYVFSNYKTKEACYIVQVK